MKWRSLEESGPETDLRPLREIFAERKELIAKYVPEETQAVHRLAVADLKELCVAANILPVGSKIPEFQLQDHDGKSVSSPDLLAKGRLVLCFIRGRWCPFCVAQMEAMNLVLPEIEQAGASLVAISPQTVQQSFFMRDQHKLRFPLLSDPGNTLRGSLGLTYRVPDEQKAIYQRALVNLPFVNGDASWELPIPATYVIDRDGTVIFASANEDYMERPEPKDILRFWARSPGAEAQHGWWGLRGAEAPLFHGCAGGAVMPAARESGLLRPFFIALRSLRGWAPN